MTLRLAQDPRVIECPTCGGQGKVPCPPTFGGHLSADADEKQPSTGHPIPCPTCKGKKVVLA